MCPHACTKSHNVKMLLLWVAVIGFRELAEISWLARQENSLVAIFSLLVCSVVHFFFSLCSFLLGLFKKECSDCHTPGRFMPRQHLYLWRMLSLSSPLPLPHTLLDAELMEITWPFQTQFSHIQNGLECMLFGLLFGFKKDNVDEDLFCPLTCTYLLPK